MLVCDPMERGRAFSFSPGGGAVAADDDDDDDDDGDGDGERSGSLERGTTHGATTTPSSRRQYRPRNIGAP
jgi:hypothetical protein